MWDATLMAVPYLRAQAGPDSGRWTTFSDRCTVLAVARTYTSATKLLEALDVFRGDHRVQVIFTFDDTSAFNAGTQALLDEHDVCLLPWEEAIKAPARLVLTASENVDLSAFDVPVVVLPHGVGFQKYVPDSRDERRRLSGVVRDEFTGWRNVRTVVSHPAQREQLRATYPALGEWAQVIGDPAHDRLQAATRLRDHYRSRLGVHPHHTLVALTSTWNEEGLLARRPSLPSALLAELPHDRYRVAAILHPNIWFAHSPWQVRHWLADALDAGLLLIPPDKGWGSVLVAADCLVGDHGSVTLYGAALDRPVLMGAFGAESVPGTAIARLATAAPRLDGDRGLREQVEAAITGHVPDRHANAASLAFTNVGDAGRRFAGFLYDLLGMPAPAGSGRVRALPAAAVDPTEVTAFEVHAWFAEQRTVAVERFPAAVRRAGDAGPGTVRHVCATETEEDDALARTASVIHRPGSLHRKDAGAWAATALQRHPGAYMAVAGAPGGCVAATRDDHAIGVHVEEGPDTCLLAALVYSVLRAGGEPYGRYALRAGGDEWCCSLNALGPSPS